MFQSENVCVNIYNYTSIYIYTYSDTPDTYICAYIDVHLYIWFYMHRQTYIYSWLSIHLSICLRDTHIYIYRYMRVYGCAQPRSYAESLHHRSIPTVLSPHKPRPQGSLQGAVVRAVLKTRSYLNMLSPSHAALPTHHAGALLHKIPQVRDLC